MPKRKRKVGKTDDEIRQRLRWADYTGVGIRAESDSYRCLVVNEKGGAHVNEDQMRRLIREELEAFFSYAVTKQRDLENWKKRQESHYTLVKSQVEAQDDGQPEPLS